MMVSAFVHDPAFMLQRRQRGGRVDYLGILFLVLSLGLLQLVLDRGERADWFNSPWVLGATLTSLIATVLLVIHEMLSKEPILDLRIMEIPLFSVVVFLVIVMSFVLWGTGALNPIFLQEYMGYTAWKAGLVMCPRAMGAMASMLLAGQMARLGYDNKRLVGLSFALMAAGLWMMSKWDLEVGVWQVIAPGIVLGTGLGMCFPILSAAALSCVERERVGYAASLYNMMRNTGAAVGIAYLTNMLVRNQQIHQSRLVEHFSVFDAWRMSSLGAHAPGAPVFRYLPEIATGQKQGLGMVYVQIQAQASMLAFNDIYRLLSTITIVMIPTFLLLRAARRTIPPITAH